MAVRIQFPDLPRGTERVAMFRTPPPEWDPERIRRIASALGTTGEPRRAGQFTIVRGRRSVLEIYRASDSLRWGLQSFDREDRRVSDPPPDAAEALEIAGSFIDRAGLADPRASFHSLGRSEVVQAERDGTETARVTAVHVNYRFELAGLPVLGPGAKMQVSIDGRRRVVEAYRFWREPVEAEPMAAIPAELAAEVLAADAMFADLDDESARVTIDHVELGYHAFPPMDRQGTLLPVYAFSGVISTRFLERYEFTRRALAVDLTPEDVKRAGTLGQRLEPIF
jgi:hypothetical protein